MHVKFYPEFVFSPHGGEGLRKSIIAFHKEHLLFSEAIVIKQSVRWGGCSQIQVVSSLKHHLLQLLADVCKHWPLICLPLPALQHQAVRLLATVVGPLYPVACL